MKIPFLMNTLDFRDVVFDSGSGPWLYTRGGEEFLDFFTDVGTASLGYNPPEHQLALRKLSEGMPIHAPNLYRSSEREEAARGLCEAAGMDRAFFCNSGTEAVEAAIKLARLVQFKRHGSVLGDEALMDEEAFGRAFTGKRHVVYSLSHAFHGRTLGSLTAGDGPPYHNMGFGPRPAGFRRFHSISDVAPDAAAVILAPVFGNNDVRLYPDEWLSDLRRYCDENGIILIFDEVQSGSGRSGLAFTYGQRIGVVPDVVTLAKGVAMGMPVGVCLARGEAADGFTPGSHFSTFGGNPISCAFVNGMLEWASEKHLRLVDEMGEYMRKWIKSLPFAKNVRGVGMLNAFDMDTDTVEYAKACLERGLLIGAFREGPGPVKVTPPLNIEWDQLERGLHLMKQAWVDIQ